MSQSIQPKLKWTKQPDGSYTSAAGRIWCWPGETWGSCCISPTPPVRWHAGRVGNLRESKSLLEDIWARHLRCTDPPPDYLVMLKEFGEKSKNQPGSEVIRETVITALVETYNGHSVVDPKPLVHALTAWWRVTV